MLPTKTIAHVEINPNLAIEMLWRIKNIVGNFQDIFIHVPGNTALLIREIKITSKEPIRMIQYPLPHAT